MRKPSEEAMRVLRGGLLAWYDERRRDLPWRRDPDPYRVWISEIMLQQTRVETVIPYYERWLRRFPTLETLASAQPDDVLRVWEGLGYYSRARNLHRAARLVREEYSGDVPSDVARLRELPGVGEYTAGAIASIAFGKAEPAVDGNVRRVLARLFDSADPQPPELRSLASALVPRDRPGDFNQALMELGATVCTARSPRCEACPVAASCRARARGTQHLRPRTRRRATVPTFYFAVAVIVGPNRDVLLVRRPERGLLARLWALPAIEQAETADFEVAARALCRHWSGDAEPLAVRGLVPLAHSFTHRRERYHPFRIDLACTAAHLRTDTARWVTPAELTDHPMSVAQRTILHRATNGPS
jgi:A/G-specific adenine glycosylase